MRHVLALSSLLLATGCVTGPISGSRYLTSGAISPDSGYAQEVRTAYALERTELTDDWFRALVEGDLRERMVKDDIWAARNLALREPFERPAQVDGAPGIEIRVEDTYREVYRLRDGYLHSWQVERR